MIRAIRRALARLTLRELLTAGFLGLAIPLSVLLAVVTPPGQVADEPAHMVRAFALLHGQIVGHRVSVAQPDGTLHPAAGVEADPAMVETGNLLPTPRSKLDAALAEKAERAGWTGRRVFFQISPIAIYMPVFYLPSAAGIGVAKLFGGGPLAAIFAGRLASVFAFAAMGAGALLTARRGRVILFCILSFPMTLSLAASFNQDGLIIAASVLAAALATRTERAARLAAAALIGCIVAVKPPYFPLAAMLLLPLPPASGRLLLQRIGVVALTLLPALLWTAFALHFVSVPSFREAYQPGPLWPGDPSLVFTSTDPGKQLQVLRANPTLVFKLPWETMAHDPWIIPTAIGFLGWLSIPLPGALYGFWQFGVASGLVADSIQGAGRRFSLRGLEALLLLLAFVACILGVYLSQYLVWTNIGNLRIDGPQGRYWLPALPLIALALPSLSIPGGRIIRGFCAIPPLAAAAAGLIVVPPVIISFFYLR